MYHATRQILEGLCLCMGSDLLLAESHVCMAVLADENSLGEFEDNINARFARGHCFARWVGGRAHGVAHPFTKNRDA